MVRLSTPCSTRALVLLLSLVLLLGCSASRPHKASFVRPSPDGYGHLLHTVDPYRATSDTRPLSREDPTFLVESPESGAIIPSATTNARFKIFTPSSERRGALGTGSSKLCLSTHLTSPPSPSRNGQSLAPGDGAQPDFHTCLGVYLPPGPGNATSDTPFEELEAHHPLYFPDGDGWYEVVLELQPGGGPPTRVTTLVYACPSLEEGQQQRREEQQQQQLLGLDMAVGGTFGWGVAGANIVRVMMAMAQATQQKDVSPAAAGSSPWLPVPLRGMDASGMSEEARQTMQPALKAAAAVALEVDAALDLEGAQVSQERWSVPLPFPVLHGLGGPSGLEQRQGVEYWGTANLAILFFENTTMPQEFLEHLKRYDVILAGSQWLRDVLLSKGLPPEKLGVFWQCVDGNIFHPPLSSQLTTPLLPRNPYAFNIFSGGKLEYRKAQDVVVAAMRRFMPQHPEARLLIAWHNPWPDYLRTLNRSTHTTGLPVVNPGGSADFTSWLSVNGIEASRVVDFGRLEQRELASLLRSSVDVAIFPNRCEGGTNLVAMEAAACGVPLILTNATGQADLLDMLGGEEAAYALQRRQEEATIVGEGRAGEDGWAEANVDEVVDRLQEVYRDRQGAAARGLRAARHLMRHCTWEGSVAGMLEKVSATPMGA